MMSHAGTRLDQAGHPARAGGRRRWARAGRILAWVTVLATIALLVKLGSSVDWSAVAQAVRDIPVPVLLLAVALVPVGYLLYAGFDVLACRYVGQRLAVRRVLGVAVISYALNLSLGTLIGGLAIRLRLYGALGLRRSTILRLTGFSVAANWIGYCWLAGAILVAGVTPVPASWEVGHYALRLVGAGMLLLGAAYLALCALSRKRAWVVRGHRIALPTGRMAVAQTLLSAASWSTMGAVMYVLLQGAVPYPAVLGVLLCTSIAALIVRIPGGLGTTEAIFVGALSGDVPAARVLGAALVYRLMYALIPMCICGIIYLGLEARRRAHKAAERRQA